MFNDGPVVDAETLTHLKNRYFRGAQETQGSGLGLAIADKLVSKRVSSDARPDVNQGKAADTCDPSDLPQHKYKVLMPIMSIMLNTTI